MKLPKARQLKSGSYNIQLRRDGESISITEKTEGACIRKATLIMQRWGTSVDREIAIEEKEISKTNPTLAQALDLYIMGRSNVLSPSTIRSYRSMREHYFKRYMNKRVKDIDYQKMINEEARIYSPKTIKNSFAFVRAAIADYDVDVSRVRLPQLIMKEKNWLTAEQIPVFLKAIEGKPCELIALLALHSLRRSEIVALRKKDITEDFIIVHGSAVHGEKNKLVRKKTNKNDASFREVPIMIPRLRVIVASMPDGVLFPKDVSHLKSRINDICKANGLPQVGIHGLRHSFCSLAYSLGFDEKTTMQIGGWSDYNTMRNIYTHISKEDVSKAADKMSKFYAEL